MSTLHWGFFLRFSMEDEQICYGKNIFANNFPQCDLWCEAKFIEREPPWKIVAVRLDLG